MFACPLRAYLLYSTFLLTFNNGRPAPDTSPCKWRPAETPTLRHAPRLADSLRRPAPDQRRKEQQRAEKHRIPVQRDGLRLLPDAPCPARRIAGHPRLLPPARRGV